MAAPRLDCYLEQLAAQPDGLAQLKAGDALHVVQHDAGLGCSTADGALVGLLPPGVVPQLRGGSWTATVRSLRWQEGALAQLQIRLTPGELSAPPPGGRARREGALVWLGSVCCGRGWPTTCSAMSGAVHYAARCQHQIRPCVLLEAGPPAANEEEEEENIARLTKEQLEHLGAALPWEGNVDCAVLGSTGREGCDLTQTEACMRGTPPLLCLQRKTRRCGGCCATSGCRRSYETSTQRRTGSG